MAFSSSQRQTTRTQPSPTGNQNTSFSSQHHTQPQPSSSHHQSRTGTTNREKVNYIWDHLDQFKAFQEYLRNQENAGAGNNQRYEATNNPRGSRGENVRTNPNPQRNLSIGGLQRNRDERTAKNNPE